MKRFFLIFASLFTFTLAHAENCQISSGNASVRSAPNGATIGQLKTATSVRVVDYNLDGQGRSWAYIYWQGQPLKTPYNGNYNAGWVSRDNIRCQ